MLKSFPQVTALESSRQALAVSGLVVLLLGAFAYSTRSKAKQPHKKGLPLAQPSTTLPFLSNTLDFIKNNDVFHDWISTLLQEINGSLFLMRAPGRPDVVVISTPEHFEDVTRRQFDMFIKGDYVLELFRDLVGEAILNVDGEA